MKGKKFPAKPIDELLQTDPSYISTFLAKAVITNDGKLAIKTILEQSQDVRSNGQGLSVDERRAELKRLLTERLEALRNGGK